MKRPYWFVIAAILALPLGTGTAHAAEHTRSVDEVRPLLKDYCQSCHGADVQLANLRVDNLSTDVAENRRTTEIWRNILNRLRRGEMPPKGSPLPAATQRDNVVAVLQTAIDHVLEQRRSTEGRTVLRRLNRTEYQRTMTDLLGYEMDYARDIPPDSLSRDGFRNNASSLRMTGIQLEYYLKAAREAMERVILSEPPPVLEMRYTFAESNMKQWKIPAERIAKNVVSRTDAFLGHMNPSYPEKGEFEVEVTAAAELKPNKGFPIMQVSVGYRPDTEILFRTLDTVELTSEEPRTFKFRGQMENFPQPVRGQSKFPGLVVRVTNVYDDGTPRPKMQTREKDDGKTEDYYVEEPDFPKVRVDKVTLVGPLSDAWPPDHHRRILFDSELQETDSSAYARDVLTKFMGRAWRRPPEPDAVDRYVEFFESQKEAFPVFEERMRETLAMVLISPEFLFLLEPNSNDERPLDAWELASRLSYFLWSTMPDDRLFSLAESGELRDPKILGAEVDRMIADERAWQLTDEFLGAWLYLDSMDRVAVNEDYHPNFTDHLKTQMRDETRQFFMKILRDDLSATNLIDSDFLVLNETMARHYGIESNGMEGIRGSTFRHVPLDPSSPRGGLLTQASLLMGNSTGSDSHPIKRAVWVRKRLLDDPPPPPPANVPELDTENPELAALSVREQLRVHRQEESCASCHKDIDPWGVAFEHFDAVGQWRDQIRKMRPRPEEPPKDPAEGGDEEKKEEPSPPEFDLLALDAHETLPDGTEIRGVDDLRAYLLGPRREDFARTTVSKVLAYALGRSLESSDDAEVNRLTARFIANDMKPRTLMREVVNSHLFQTK